jgi:hypothetical protein
MLDSDSFNLQDDPINRYKRVDKIGKGTYGVVYLAIDMKTNEEVALKKMIIHVVYFDPAERKRRHSQHRPQRNLPLDGAEPPERGQVATS